MADESSYITESLVCASGLGCNGSRALIWIDVITGYGRECVCHLVNGGV